MIYAVQLPRRRHAGSLMAALVLISGCSDDADLPRSTQTIDGMTIEFGVIPAESLKNHATAPSDPNALHGGTPPNSSSHHIVVALFDAKSGARITDAQVRAGVGDRSYNHEPDITLEPMEINGAMSYGNFFSMPREGVWRVHLEVRRPGMTQPVEADFSYDRVTP